MQRVQENELKLLEAQEALIGRRDLYIAALTQQLALRAAMPSSSPEELAMTGAAYTSNELAQFLAEQKVQLEREVRSFRARRDSPPALFSSKGFKKVVRQEIDFVAKSLSNLLQSRKTRAELVENAILFDYSYETPDGHSSSPSHTSSLSPSSYNTGTQPNTGLNVTLGMTTEEVQLLSQFHAFARNLSKENLVLKWSDIEREEKLGEGAYSVVEQGWCQGRLVAIKLFKTSRNSALQAFMREVNALRANKSNPNTVKLLGVCVESREKLCIVTPLYKGGSIHDALYKHGHIFSQEQALTIAKDLAEGLAQIHSAGFIHRDITPTNILLHPDMNGKSFIADFGISIPLAEASSMTTIGVAKSPRGHPRYKAPEMVSRDPYNEKIDIWQYGTMLYVLFSNRRPFEAVADREVSAQMALGEMPDTSHLPQAIKDVIVRCWHLLPTQRPTAKQLVEMNSEMSTSSLLHHTSADLNSSHNSKSSPSKLTKSHSEGEIETKKKKMALQTTTTHNRKAKHCPQHSLVECP